MKKYDYILFDLDGTITDPFFGITKSVQYSLKKFDIESELEQLRSFIGPPLIDSYIEYFGFDEEKAKLAVEYYREYYRDKGIFDITVYDGIKELVKKLSSNGKKVILATSKPKIFADMILEKLEIKDFFAATFGSELDGTRVKKGDVIAYANENYPFIKDKAIMVGDRKHDIIGAHQNGIACVGVLYGYGSMEEFIENNADLIVKDVKELESILL